MSSHAAGRPGPSAGPPLVRVLHLVKGLNAGGAEHLLVLAARHRDRARFDYEVAYLLPRHVALRGDLGDEGVPTTCLEAERWWDPRWVLRLRRRLRRRPVDVVHAHSPLVASGARLAALALPRRVRPRLVVTLHNVWTSHHRAVRLVDRLTYRLDDARIAVSDAARRSLPGRAGTRATTLVHGIDVAPLRARADRATVRREMGVAEDEVLIGSVANPSPAKGYPDLIDAAERVTAARPEVRFVAIGEGPSRVELERRRDDAGLGGRFRFLGHRPDAARLTSGFDVFCLASHHEGLPLALMEALVLGIPVVVTRVGGMAELVTDGREGITVPPARPDLLAAALSDEVDHPDRRAAHAAAAWCTGSDLDAQVAVRSVEAVYERLASPPPVTR